VSSYDDDRCLRDAIRAAERIRTICGGTFEALPVDDGGDPRTVSREAIKYNVIVIGETVSRLSEPTMSRAPEVPWVRVKGVRNVLTHQYHNVDDESVPRRGRHDPPAGAGRGM